MQLIRQNEFFRPAPQSMQPFRCALCQHGKSANRPENYQARMSAFEMNLPTPDRSRLSADI